MKILYYDCFSGISGDMNLGAMIDLGVDEKYLRDQLKKLDIKGWELVVEKDQRHGIFGTKVTVKQTVHEHIHRHPSDIEKIISGSGLPESTREISRRIFREVAVAEAKVHQVPYEEVHFHEVGAIDSIVDIIGAAICYDSLGITDMFVSTLELGSGTVKCAHGILPVPAPATAEIVTGIPVNIGGVAFEATTPTGAAIIKSLGTGFGKPPEMVIKKTGYGIGHKENPERPNILRVSICETVEKPIKGEKSMVIECNIDDMSPEWYEEVITALFSAGASDVFYSPITMKRNRPATKLSVLCREEVVDRIKDTLFEQSTTIGLRIIEIEKHSLERQFLKLSTGIGEIGIKYSYHKGKLVSLKPEYNDCSEAARKNKMTLKEVYRYMDKILAEENDRFKN